MVRFPPVVGTAAQGARVTSGDFTRAAELLEQSDAISIATGAPPHRSIRTYLAACRGREQQVKQLAQATIQEATTRGEGSEVTVVLFSAAVLHNGLAQYNEALTACTSALEYDDVGMSGHLLNEMVEAAARSDKMDTAATAAARLIERAEAAGTATARGYSARAKALIATGPAAESEYRGAITELQSTPLAVLTARTQLLFGEWLRRTNRRAEASDQLRVARPRAGPNESPGQHVDSRVDDPRKLYRPGCRRRLHQLRNRQPSIHQSSHGGMAPQQYLRQTRCVVPPRIETPAWVIATPTPLRRAPCQGEGPANSVDAIGRRTSARCSALRRPTQVSRRSHPWHLDWKALH